MRVLDLFSGAGGAAAGYWAAGFHQITGVDHAPQPRYPFRFVQADAMTYPVREMRRYDLIHASPPCQRYSKAGHDLAVRAEHPDLIAPLRERLMAAGVPWVIENVPGAPMRADLRLCGCVAGLPGLERERWFETWPLVFDLRPPCHHTEPTVTVAGHGRGRGMYTSGLKADWERVMRIDWMTREQLKEAVPPAYTELVGALMLAGPLAELAAA